ncbi:hypothetical protein HELRODRAFT_84138 [Helobdella robusta]|uniref:Uncharacterized protein n=1 Tax=Helobdella robusta TaxID=6412 RepID=T1G5F2_HELRO|nr:hypothetical protein HELRODRAFT_84138 [Helobdella robusta]ESN99564.1 hypothetical protein HELRODRAFT_84138 [Helobdella robusta]
MSEEINERLIEELSRVEFASDEVIGLKHQLVLFDTRRQKTREAYRALLKEPDDGEMVSIWMENMFIKFTHNKAKEYLEKEMKNLNEEYEKTRTLLKEKVKELQDLEGSGEWKGFRLNPLPEKELKNVVSNSSIFHP